jgi:L-ascorbate metabolism protein UlaG (beta-lactamase superfamily)
MKITKFTHSCLLVEMPAPTDRTALFDPGVFSTYNIDDFKFLDDIIITHEHADHMDIDRIKALRAKFPKARITAPADAKVKLDQAGVTGVSNEPSEGMKFFHAPHEEIAPLGWGPQPDEIGVHYLDMLSDPGDSHTFTETMPILALPVQAPWGSTVQAVKVALDLKPKYIIPVHDWHWNNEARQQMYDRLEQRFAEVGTTFIKPVDGEPFVIKL